MHHLAQEADDIFGGAIELDESHFLLSGYNALDVSGFYHERTNHSNLFGRGKNHFNGIENFWNQANRVLRKYNGILKESFPLFLKECEFRFNYGTSKQQQATLKNGLIFSANLLQPPKIFIDT